MDQGGDNSLKTTIRNSVWRPIVRTYSSGSQNGFLTKKGDRLATKSKSSSALQVPPATAESAPTELSQQRAQLLNDLVLSEREYVEDLHIIAKVISSLQECYLFLLL
jgi:hypothetical protein